MLVTAVCLTRNRRDLLPVALRCFQEQDWPEKELLVVDDGGEDVKDLCAVVPGCRYYRTAEFRSVGEKLNFACDLARGEFIATLDDDDWSAPSRFTDQVWRITDSGAALVGYTQLYFHDGEHAWKYSAARDDYAVGTSQFYRRTFWKAHPAPALMVGYDNHFWNHALSDGGARCAAGLGMMVARIHGRNVSRRPHPPDTKKNSNGHQAWSEVSLCDLPPAFFDAIRGATVTA